MKRRRSLNPRIKALNEVRDFFGDHVPDFSTVGLSRESSGLCVRSAKPSVKQNQALMSLKKVKLTNLSIKNSKIPLKLVNVRMFLSYSIVCSYV